MYTGRVVQSIVVLWCSKRNMHVKYRARAQEREEENQERVKKRMYSLYMYKRHFNLQDRHNTASSLGRRPSLTAAGKESASPSPSI